MFAGTGIGLVLGERTLGVARIVAAVVALGAVALQLVPDAVSEVGWWALLAVVAGLAVPMVVELAGRRLATVQDGAGNASLELAYLGLLAHQFGDGVALGALGSDAHDHGHEVSMVALAVHAVALSAVFVLAFRHAKGRRSAAIRGGGMAFILATGAVLAGVLPAAWLVWVHPWVAAVTAGVLLHVALHPFTHRLHSRAAPVAQ